MTLSCYDICSEKNLSLSSSPSTGDSHSYIWIIILVNVAIVIGAIVIAAFCCRRAGIGSADGPYNYLPKPWTNQMCRYKFRIHSLDIYLLMLFGAFCGFLSNFKFAHSPVHPLVHPPIHLPNPSIHPPNHTPIHPPFNHNKHHRYLSSHPLQQELHLSVHRQPLHDGGRERWRRR